MTSQYLQSLFITVAVVVSGFSTDTECPKYTPGQLLCEKTLQEISVESGNSLTLNCTCFSRTNGQWFGPNKLTSTNLAATDLLPYTQGTYLNPQLNKSKYNVLDGYDNRQCRLKIMNFLSVDDGTYMCQYVKSSTIYTHIYNVSATSIVYFEDMSTDNQAGNGRKTDISTVGTERKYITVVLHNYEHGSSASYIYSWVIMGSVVGVLVICFILSHIYCCAKRQTKSREMIVFSPEIQYDEIGTLNHDDVIMEPIFRVSDDNRGNTSRVFVYHDSLVQADEESSIESTFIQNSALTQSDGDYENPYQQYTPENTETYPYTCIISNNYQNTIIFSHSAQSKTKVCGIGEDNTWLVIYVKRNELN